MSQIQTTLKPKDIEAVKNRVDALFDSKLGKIHYNQMIQNKGAYMKEPAGQREIDEGIAACQCLETYRKYWESLEIKLKVAPVCSEDGKAYMKRMQERANYACKWIEQTKRTQLKAWYGSMQI